MTKLYTRMQKSVKLNENDCIKHAIIVSVAPFTIPGFKSDCRLITHGSAAATIESCQTLF